jgi:putative copper resistance protein D
MNDISNDLLIAIRAIHFAATLSTTGTLFFWYVLAEPAVRKADPAARLGVLQLRAWYARIVWVGLATAVVSGAIWVVLLAADFGGHPLIETLATDLVPTVLASTRFGNLALLRLAVSVVLAATLATASRDQFSPSTRLAATSLACAACLAGSLAWIGHAGATEGASGGVHLIADVLHLGAAAAWLGGLLALALLLHTARGAADETWTTIARDTTRRFSLMGLISVGTLVATGAVNTWLLLGTLPALVGTHYGRLLLLKIALFAGMLSLAAINRVRLTPELSKTPDAFTLGPVNALRTLERNSLGELALGVTIVFLVGVLGTTTPAAHVQPWWPFPLRFEGAIFNHPTLLYRMQAIFAAAASVAGILSLLAAIWLQALRLPLTLTAVLGISLIPQCVRLLTVEAFPTTFYTSPTGYSVASIARGQVLFTEHCAQCHGQDGRGADVLGRDGKRVPDLTGDHVYAHRDGDLFWWITNGKDAMPGLGAVIDETGRWNLIDFLLANADAVHVRSFGADDLLSVSVPDFACETANALTLSTAQLRGQIITILFAHSRSTDRVREFSALNLGADVTKVLVPLDQAASDRTPVCIAHEPAVPLLFAGYRDGDVAALDGVALIVDAAGFLRSMQPSASVSVGLIDDIRNRPALPRSTMGRMHHH